MARLVGREGTRKPPDQRSDRSGHQFAIGELGQEAEDEWRDRNREDGNVVLPTTLLAHNTPERGAPCLYTPDGPTALTDFLVHDGKGLQAHEIKSKRGPSWSWSLRQWGHGVDLASYDEYLAGQKALKIPVLIFVREKESPDCPMCDGELTPLDVDDNNKAGKRCRCKACGKRYEKSALFPGPRWLGIWLDQIAAIGIKRPKWPDQRGGKDGRGGILWRRSAMMRMDREKDAAVLRKIKAASVPLGTQLKLT